MDERKEEFPLITVITLSYNSPDLNGAICSVLNQTYPRIEYILVDDHSSHYSLSAITEFLDRHKKENIEKYKVIQNPRNYGTVYSANLAVRRASGEYLFFLAGDDQFHDSSVLVDWMREFKCSSAQVITAYREVYDEKMEVSYGKLPDKSQVQGILKNSSQKLFEKIAVENFIFGCATAYRRSFLVEMGMFNEKYRLIEDKPLILKILRTKEKIHFFDRIVVKYRSGGVSAAARNNSFLTLENQKIFEEEALPYSKTPSRLQKRYQIWEREQKERQKFYLFLEKHKVNSGKKYLAYVLYFFLHPLKNIKHICMKPRRYMIAWKKRGRQS